MINQWLGCQQITRSEEFRKAGRKIRDAGLSAEERIHSREVLANFRSLHIPVLGRLKAELSKRAFYHAFLHLKPSSTFTD